MQEGGGHLNICTMSLTRRRERSPAGRKRRKPRNAGETCKKRNKLLATKRQGQGHICSLSLNLTFPLQEDGAVREEGVVRVWTVPSPTEVRLRVREGGGAVRAGRIGRGSRGRWALGKPDLLCKSPESQNFC